MKKMKNLRRISDSLFEISRASEESNQVVVEGYAAVWDSDSEILNERGKTFIERIKPYAFTRALENLDNAAYDCVATFQHVRDTLLARTKSGTLKLWQDDKGLKFRFKMPNTRSEISEMIERGDLSQCSFIARVNPESIEVEKREDGTMIQTIGEFDLIRDISLVIDPAYSETEVAEVARYLEEFEQAEKEEQEAQRQLQDEIESQNQMLNDLISKYETN